MRIRYIKEAKIAVRSDSTLRGHYPLETELLKENYGKNTGKAIDGEILCPFFKEGGRFTIDNVHYVKYGEDLVPANETEFAKDKTFGYSASTLPEYVEEKTKEAYKASDVTCISLEDIHNVDIDKMLLKRKTPKQCRKPYLVADQSKFGRQDMARINHLGDYTGVITDKTFTEDEQEKLRELHADIISVKKSCQN